MIENRLTTKSDRELLSEDVEIAAAFAVFYRRHVYAVLRFSAARGISAADAADVAAETFASAYAARRSFRRGDDARNWVLTIARNQVEDLRRRDRVADSARTKLQLERVAMSTSDEEAYAELLSLDDRADPDGRYHEELDRLPAEQRAAVNARVIDGDGYSEIGERLGISEPAARQRVSRGLSTLRARLKGQG